MCRKIAVSNWELYRKYHENDRIEDYVNHLAGLEEAADRPDRLILREKKLLEAEYEQLLEMIWEKFRNSEIELIPHTYLAVVQKMGIGKIHLPFHLLKKHAVENQLQSMEVIGTSIHSVEEAKEAEQLGATYVTAGHIFTTDCKPGLEPRGLEFLEQVCENVKIPVYAIGGIHPNNIEKIEKSSAAGACMMSEYMK